MDISKFNLATGFFASHQKYPQNTALFYNRQVYTYQFLLERVLVIYDFLCQQNIQAPFIGIHSKDKAETVAAILAISAYGAAYVPLNPQSPTQRNQFIVKDCGLKIILTDAVLSNDLDTLDGKVLHLPSQKVYTKAIEYPPRKIEQDIAYVLYTSGSTGKPKGVPVSFENIQPLFQYFDEQFDFNEKDRFLQVFEWTFDISVFALLTPLYKGASCYLLPETGIKFLNILQQLKEQQITVVCLVPSLLSLTQKYFKELSLPKMRHCLFAGEALPHTTLEEWAKVIPNSQIYNFYGPTEAAVFCTSYLWEKATSAQESIHDIVPIGKLLPNLEYQVVDKNNEKVPQGQIGELCITGKQVVRQYLHNIHPEKFFKINTQHFYRTGDLVQVNQYNNLIYIGRNDEQVQIQGHRVELKEIEYHLKKILACNVAVVVQKSKLGENILVAFVEGKEVNEVKLKKNLQQILNVYMIPRHIMAIKKMPLNVNDKIDRKALEKIQP